MTSRELTVLAIDDDAEDALLLQQALQDMPGFQLTFLHSGSSEEGLAMLASRSVDATFLDYKLGGETAPEVLRTIRAAGDIRPIIVLTGQGDELTAAEVLRSGADDYLVKSVVSPRVLGRALQHAEERFRRRLAEQALSQKNCELARLLDREKKISQQLQDALKHAEMATRSKSEFLANMSHEIRTPMTAILGYVDVLMDPAHTAADHENIIQIIQRNGEHLLSIINDILDISKIEAGRMELERVPCSPMQIAQDVVTMLWDRAAAKNLFLKIECASPVPEVIHSDPTRLRQILINLLSNAIKFTNNGGVRMVAAMADPPDSPDPHVVFDVIDSGIGMSEQQEKLLFQAFAQADNSTTRKYGGTGLGLVISKRLAQMMGGDITMACIPDVGCTFRATVSTGPLQDVKMVHGFDNNRLGNKVRPAQTAGLDRPVRILLAEDAPDNQRLISFVLKKAGATVEIAGNGREAYEMAMTAFTAGQPFDVILMDMQMPEMDGYAATAKLRSEGYGNPIIALTAHAMSSARDRCLDAGCDEFATKPIDKNRLLALIAQFAQPQSSPVQ